MANTGGVRGGKGVLLGAGPEPEIASATRIVNTRLRSAAG